MTRNNFLKTLLYLLVMGAGIFISWNVFLFRPFSANYPPNAPYKVTDLRNGKPDSVLAAAGEHYQRSRFGEFWLGKHYRSLWAQPVKVKVLDMESSGLKVLKRGGGMQTTSFTLGDADGREYALRSVDKNPMGVLPKFWWPTAVSFFVRDQVSATDPYASLVVNALSEKAGIPFVQARLFFLLPHDKAFEKHNVTNGGFYNLSLKTPEPEKLQLHNETFAGVFSSEEMATLLDKKNSRSSIDTALFLRCRLFDLLIGDWDRHPGQWDWLAFATETDTVFRPFPKDRDQALGYYQDGIFPYIFTRKFVVRKISSFTPEYEDMEGFTQNGSVLDIQYLKKVPLKKILSESRALQTALSEPELAAAMRRYPKEVYPKIADKHFSILKVRRHKLPEAAKAFYELIQARKPQ